MNSVFRFLSVIAAVMMLPLSVPAWAGPLEDLSALQKDLKSVRAPFKQKKLTELLPRAIKSKGTFYFSDGAGVRWEYDGQMVVIYDNESLYLHYIELSEAEKVDGIAGFNGPLSFNVKELARDYDIKTSVSEAGDITLHLVPRQLMPFENMRMVFKKGEPFPSEVRVMEATGDETVISFIDPEFNLKLKGKLFVFTPPRGVKVRVRQYN